MIYIIPSYFPSIIYYWHILNAEVEYNVSLKYQKQTTRNRCVILSANGPQKLIIPIKKDKGKNKGLYDYNARIDNSQNWKTKHWKSIENAYRSSPYFEFYENELSKVFFKDVVFLFNLNIKIISHINQILGFKRKINVSKEKIIYERYDERLINVKDYFFCKIPEYNQVFMSKYRFISNLSILDLLFNLGPQTVNYLTNYKPN